MVKVGGERPVRRLLQRPGEGWWWLVAEDRLEAEGREDGLPERQEEMWQEASVVLFCSTGFKSLLVVLLHV